MRKKLIYNKIVDRFEIVADNAVAYFKSTSVQVSDMYGKLSFINLTAKLIFQLRAYIPNLENVIRRFVSQENNILLDVVSGVNSKKILLASVFDGVDGCVLAENVGNQLNTNISLYFSSTTAQAFKAILSVGSGGGSASSIVIDVGDGTSIRFFGYTEAGVLTGELNGGDITPYLDGDWHKLTASIINGTDWYLDIDGDVLINTLGRPTLRTSELSALSLGCRYSSSYLGIAMRDIQYDNLFIPLPHLYTTENGIKKGFGFDANNNVIRTTVSGGVSLGYDINGSSYLQDKGNVERNPELVVNGNLSDGLVGYINRADVPFEVFENIEGKLHLSTPSGVKVAGNNSFTLDKDIDYIFTFNADITSGTWLAAGRVANELTGAPISLGSVIDGPNTLHINSSQLIEAISFATLDGGEAFFSNLSVTLATPEIIPNTPTGQPAYPIVSGDTFIAGGGMMNLTDCLVRLYEIGDTDPAKLFFDLSNTLIWNDRARQDYYDANNTGDIHTSILKQAELYLTFEAAYKYRLWSKINSNGVFKDIFLYANQLQGENICLAKRYVGVGEIYTTIEDDTLICRNDIIE